MATIRLPKELEDRLSMLAETTKRSKSFYIREAIDRHLDDIEDTYIALYRLEHPSKKLTIEEMEKKLGLD